MGRFKELKEASLPLSITAAVAVGTAAIFSARELKNDNFSDSLNIYPEGVKPVRIVEKEEENVQVIDLLAVGTNYKKTVDWLSSLNNPQVNIYKNEFSKHQKEILTPNSSDVTIISSGKNNKDYFSVIPTVSPDGIEVKIGFSGTKLSDINFNIQEAAIDLFLAQSVFGEAKLDPKRYAQDANFRHSLHQKAQEIARVIFKDIVPRQSAVV